MLNIYTVKWGEKYTALHVNQLFESCKQHISVEFTFHCLTENPKDLHKDIVVIAFPGGNDLVKWWNKMYLFDLTSNTTR